MPEYTLTPIPDMALYVDGIPAIAPASNIGAAVLNDFYHYLLNPSTGNSVGVTLRYVHPSSSWILPNGEPALFNLGMADDVFFEIMTQIKAYAKANYLVTPLGSLWGYLATDAGNYIEVTEDELIELKPQLAVGAGREVYYQSNLDEDFSVSSIYSEKGKFLLPDRKDVFQDYAFGSLELNVAPTTLEFKMWKLLYAIDTEEFFVKRTDRFDLANILFENNVTRVSLALDPQNRPQVAYTANDKVYLYWYSENESRYLNMEIPNAKNAYLAQINPANYADVILAYQKGPTLAFLKYTESYEFERVVMNTLDENLELYQAGLTNTGKFQWKFLGK
ncbi:tail fiber protein [Acinetobacter phage EAb13]|nr:tail fiber protein [Acinetobacter phage EAb13]